MPPKAAGVSHDAFLAACLRSCTEKPNIDFNKLAEATGMSKGGAANKYRAIMKQFENDDADGSGDAQETFPATPEAFKKNGTTKRKTPVKKVQKSTIAVANSAQDGDVEEDDEDVDEPPAKKKARDPRSAAKKTTSRGKAKKAVATTAVEVPSDDDEDKNSKGECKDDDKDDGHDNSGDNHDHDHENDADGDTKED